MSNPPLLSIVVPTRNRGHLLGNALASASRQVGDDIEILVSDNCSSDDTRAVATSIVDDRVRLVSPDRPLSMTDHWEFAVSQARGEWLTVLCDDDALLPSWDQHVRRAVGAGTTPIIVWQMSLYWYPTWTDPEVRNSLRLFPYSGLEEIQSSRQNLSKLLSSAGHADHYPRMLNSLVHRELLGTIRSRLGRVFISNAPDYSFCAAALGASERVAWIDRPLALAGFSNESIGASQGRDRGAATRTFVAEYDRFRMPHVPLTSLTLTNITLDSVLAVRAEAPEWFRGLEPDWAIYFHRCHTDLMVLAQNGVDIRSDMAEWQACLGRQSSAVQYWVCMALGNGPCGEPPRARGIEWVRRALRKLGNPPPGPEAADGDKHATGAMQVVRGDEWGFTDILTCAEWLDASSVPAFADGVSDRPRDSLR